MIIGTRKTITLRLFNVGGEALPQVILLRQVTALAIMEYVMAPTETTIDISVALISSTPSNWNKPSNW